MTADPVRVDRHHEPVGDHAGSGRTDPAPFVVDVGGVPMSGLAALVDRPRGVVVALHGGASSSVYWDCPGHPELSFLRAAAAAGWSAVALDRPGYGRSATCAEDIAALARRVPLTLGAVDRVLAGRDRGAGLVVVGHSIGCELAVRVVVDGGHDVRVLVIAGTGREEQPALRRLLAPAPGEPQALPRAARLHQVLWEPAQLYPGDIVGGAAIGSPSPRYERTVVAGWAARDFAALAARVRVPVHYALGQHERAWSNDAAAMARVGALFTASPRVVVATPPDAGHNLSVGLTAPAYHRAILEFAEEGTR